MRGFFIAFSILVFFTLESHGTPLAFEAWLMRQETVAREQILKQVSPSDGLPGSVMASPSRSNPDYYYHWVRDAALVMQTILDKSLGDSVLLDQFEKTTQIHQYRSGIHNLGEPKYYMNGNPYTGPWGRPQNDGPALRAIVLINYGAQLEERGSHKRALQVFSTASVDLDYVVRNWSQPSFDLWEEVKGDHFYTLMVQRKAMLVGAEFAKRTKRFKQSSAYLNVAKQIENKLRLFFASDRILVTRNFIEGIRKPSELDTAVVLGILHGSLDDDMFLPLNDKHLLNTVNMLEATFKKIYPIASQGVSAVAYGRYPEDVYYGGNPWFLTTLAIAEYHYKLASFFLQKGHFDSKAAHENYQMADEILKRVKYHVPGDLHLSEQYDRTTGFCLGAQDLTWSYAAFLTAKSARDQALSRLRKSDRPIRQN